MIAVVIAPHGTDECIELIKYLNLSGLSEEKVFIFDNISEPFGKNLNIVLNEYWDDDDILFVNADVTLKDEAIKELSKDNLSDKKIGAISIAYSDEYSSEIQNISLANKLSLIKADMIKEIKSEIDYRMNTPEFSFMDISLLGIEKGFYYLGLPSYNLITKDVNQVNNDINGYFGTKEDNDNLYEKWKMNYFVSIPHTYILESIQREKDEQFTVLEVGCDCGGNLLHLKNKYPNAELKGLEINENSARIANCIFDVEVGNIEDKNFSQYEGKLDYIIFGDVLEHLRDPEGVINYCRKLLKEDGMIVASVPNIMHYTVMMQLLNGKFTYTDTGLLDRTHIHFFTEKEIRNMFDRCGYIISDFGYTVMDREADERAKPIINHLLALSDGTVSENNYKAFQYVFGAKKIKENNERVRMYVMTHKEFKSPVDDIYIPLQVGSALGKDLGYLRDDTGDNISDLNPFFGELTGFYWLWKNVHDVDTIGTCHYRRYFGDNGSYLSADDCRKLLTNADIICSNILETTRNTYKDEYKEAHNIEDLLLVGNAIQELYPNDYEAFDESLGRNDHTFGNLLIMKKGIFDEYCEWMFNIFMWMLDKVDFSKYDDYHKRLFGFLSENLIRVFAKSRGYTVKPGHIYINDEKVETKELKQIVFSLIREKNVSKAKELLLSYTKSRPDVLLPLSDLNGELTTLIEIIHYIENQESGVIKELYKHTGSLDELIDYFKRKK